jgi:hypothetical protein
MKRIYFIMLVSFFALPALKTHAQTWQWARGASGADEGGFCTTDASNNVYVAGGFGNMVHFGTDTIRGHGTYVVKFDSAGNKIWGIGTSSDDTAGWLWPVITPMDIKTDKFNNLYLLGVYDSTVIFGSHILTLPGPRNKYYYLAKINSAGVVQWIKSVGNIATSHIWTGTHMAIDKNGLIYISGGFSQGGTIGGYAITNAATDSSEDIFIGKFDSSGSVLWAKCFGGRAGENSGGISVTPGLNIYINGSFSSDTVLFGSTSLYDTGASHMNSVFFVAKLDSLGNIGWVKGEGGNCYSVAGGLVANQEEEVYVTGSYFGAALSLGSHTLPFPTSGMYGFIAKYDLSGNVLWAEAMQGRNVVPWAITMDPCNNVWISSSSEIRGGSDTIDGHIITPPDIADPMFIASWNAEGSFISATTLVSGGDDFNILAIDRCGNVYVAGDFNIDTFIIGNDTLITDPSMETDFIAKYDPNIGCHCGSELQKDPQPYNNISLYPNPAHDQIIISATTKIKNVIINNIVGQRIYNQVYDAEKVQVDVADLPAGIYFARINGIVVRKFVKE